MSEKSYRGLPCTFRKCAVQREARRRSDFRCAAIRSAVVWRTPSAVANAIGYAEHRSRSHHAVIHVYDEGGNVIGTHEHKGRFKDW